MKTDSLSAPRTRTSSMVLRVPTHAEMIADAVEDVGAPSLDGARHQLLGTLAERKFQLVAVTTSQRIHREAIAALSTSSATVIAPATAPSAKVTQAALES